VKRAFWPAGPFGLVRRLLAGAALFVLLLALLVFGREVVIRGALRRAGAAARALGEATRVGLPEARPSAPPSEALSWLLEPEVAPADEAGPAKVGKAAPAAPRLGPAPTPVVTLNSDVVLRLAEQGAAPRGVARAQAGDLPAGIEILGGGALGIGWFPGDRLIEVDGVPVLDRTQVVRTVVERRARREPIITATVARRTAQGVATYRVLVAQPYVD